MNTEDERRDEAEAALTAASGVRLEGDVITANGSIISGIIPMENYLHNTSVYPFTPSRFHVYNYPPNASAKESKKKFSKTKFNRTNQLEQEHEMFSDDPEYLDAQNYYENQENLELDSELMTETSSNQLNNKAFFQNKQILISDSNSERTLSNNKNHLKAHHHLIEQSELSLSSLNSSSKRRTSKVFCKTSNQLLSKQQRKNYKHMISEEEESEQETSISDRASVCSCTCYGNNQSGTEFWRKNKNKKPKKPSSTTQMELQRPEETMILNRKLPTNKRHKNQNSAAKSTRTPNVKYKNSLKMTNNRNRPSDQEEFNLNQSNRMQSAETILRPIYYQQTPLSTTTNQTPLINEHTIHPLNLFYLNNSANLEHQQQFSNCTNDQLVIKQTQQRPFVMQSNHLNHHDLSQLANENLSNKAFENLRNQFICNLSSANVGNLSNSDHVLNQLNAINAKNLTYFVDDEKGFGKGFSANQLSYTKDENAQFIELNEKIKHHDESRLEQIKLMNKIKEKDKLKLKDRMKDKKRKINQKTNRLTIKASEKQGSSEYLLLKRSNEEGIEIQKTESTYSFQQLIIKMKIKLKLIF